MERKIEFTPKKIAFYIIGFFILGLGVNTMARSDLGLGAWDTVTFNLNLFLNESITKGMTSWIVSLTVMFFVILYNKKLVLLFMIIPVLMVGLSIDFWDLLVFNNIGVPSEMYLRLILFIVGGTLIPLGLASIVSSHFPAFVFDELTLVIMDMLNTKSITKGRYVVEGLGISFGILFGLLAKVGFGYVSYGSIIFAFILPPIFNFFVKTLGKL